MHSTKNENPTSLVSPNALKCWILAARPKTLIAGISPAVIGSAIAMQHGWCSPWIFLLCFTFSVSIQIGTNWANDYFDYVKGADTASRKGPARAVQSGWISPMVMRNAAVYAFLFAALSATPLLMRIGFSFIPLMLLCIVCGILYTGGKKPLGYLGLGEILVLIFYGPVATCCTAYAHLLFLPPETWVASLAPGLLSCAILCINNLRDAVEDRKAGKMTLVARFGERFGQWEYLFLLLGVAFVPLFLSDNQPLYLLLFLLFPLAKKSVQIVFQRPEEIHFAFAQTVRLLILYTALYAILSV